MRYFWRTFLSASGTLTASVLTLRALCSSRTLAQVTRSLFTRRQA